MAQKRWADYSVITSESVQELEVAVNAEMRSGMQPVGGVFVMAGAQKGRKLWVQAMARKERLL